MPRRGPFRAGGCGIEGIYLYKRMLQNPIILSFLLGRMEAMEFDRIFKMTGKSTMRRVLPQQLCAPPGASDIYHMPCMRTQ